jgi:hypothetical protein
VDPILLRQFQTQIWHQCRFALLAYEEFQGRLATYETDHVRQSSLYGQLSSSMPLDEFRARSRAIALELPSRLWAPMQSFLTAVANISKALWGQSGRHATKRAALRASLGVTDPSPLAVTSMRNNFDHFDDRLDTWWTKSVSKNSVDFFVGDVASAIVGVSTDEMFRSYDPATGDLVFWGDRYNIPTVVAEIERLMDAANREASKPLRYP